MPDLAEAPTVILFGISGVGKTTAATEMLARFPALLHFQASSLLKGALSQTGEALRTATPGRIAENQAALAAALKAARKPFPGQTALMDAHSVIDNDETLVALPLETFAALNPVAITFLKAPPHKVLARREEDVRRRPSRSVEQINRYQEVAEAVARAHARSLRVPFLAIDSSDLTPLANLIEKIADT